jgi:copper chaperone CopZ
MSTREFTVTGMTCGHCVQSVTEEVSEVPGVVDVKVVLETGALTVTGDAQPAAVLAAVAEAGYEAVEAAS